MKIFAVAPCVCAYFNFRVTDVLSAETGSPQRNAEGEQERDRGLELKIDTTLINMDKFDDVPQSYRPSAHTCTGRTNNRFFVMSASTTVDRNNILL